MNKEMHEENLVFGLDIGTRSIVGTVGYMDGDRFVVVAQYSKEHQTRSMLDGQIHDIVRVGATIREVKSALELQLGFSLKEVCIAAAGRVLKTITKHVEYDLHGDKVVTPEDVYTLESMGVEQSYQEFQEQNMSDLKFYSVGYSVVKYYMNGYPTSNLVHHKAHHISLDIISTFLPDDVVEGLYAAVKEADLEVINLTLEPIAAIRLAIPEKFRMLNIGLIDVGAGTSDISITRDGSVIAYGMIPCAGDSLTEKLARHCLIDFATAERIKIAITTDEVVEYEDIMGIEQQITRAEVLELLHENITHMAELAAEELKRLNGGSSPSAVFVVGGGGKIPTYTDTLADILGIARNRVALRGKEVMEDIVFCEGVKKDSLLVTPLGICMCYYEQTNNFLFVNFNDQKIKLFDNRKLTIMDAVMQMRYPSEGLFPRRGKSLTYFVNGKERTMKGESGESAVILCNGESVDINHALHANDIIRIQESTEGEDASLLLEKLPEYHSQIKVVMNQKEIMLPKLVHVNGKQENASYLVNEGDRIEVLDYYTVAQLATYLDINLDEFSFVSVNNLPASMETEVYDNFSVQWLRKAPELYQNIYDENVKEVHKTENTTEKHTTEEASKTSERETDKIAEEQTQKESKEEKFQDAVANASGRPHTDKSQASKSLKQEKNSLNTKEKNSIDKHEKHSLGKHEKNSLGKQENRAITIIVNNKPVILKGKPDYMFVDIFDFIDFDTSKMRGSGIATIINGHDAQYTEALKNGDKIEVFWRE